MLAVGIPLGKAPTPAERAEHERQYIINAYKRQTLESLLFIEALRQKQAGQVSPAAASAPDQA